MELLVDLLRLSSLFSLCRLRTGPDDGSSAEQTLMSWTCCLPQQLLVVYN